jgi:pyruvate formate lyase activating enzyme
MKETNLYKGLDDKKVRCLICAHSCTLGPGKRGICGVRENQDGRLMSLVYGRAIALNVDPIEKKPLFHFYPGTKSFSIATVGCNMRCLHCQNADISQMARDQNQIQGQDVSPDLIVKAALDHQCRTIAYTYTEPAVFFDYALDTARLAQKKGIKNIFVTNGYLSEMALKEVAPYLDGANVDLKSFKDQTYRDLCGARLQPVLDSIRRMKKMKIWVEVTTLLIPGINDSEEELKEIAEFIRSCDPGIPWHISRFHPTYRLMDKPPTSVKAVQKARDLGLEAGLRFVYTGNVPDEKGESTFCYSCGAKLIHRRGFEVDSKRIVQGKCPECGVPIDGVW